jgi:RNA polymerase sigma-70 factor (ECF subfamily)
MSGGERDLNAYFNEVYANTFKSVTRFVTAKCGSVLDAEDIVQNVYSRFFSRISKKGFNDIDNAEAFVVNIAKFECRNYFTAGKKKSERQSLFSDYSDEKMVEIEAEMSKTNTSFEDILENETLAKQIFDDITTGDPDIGKIFYMHFVLDMKLDQIAADLGLSLSSVKNKLYRTIERQKRKFGI